jgi:hypothetical protein
MRRWVWLIALALVLASGCLAIVGGRLHGPLGDTLMQIAVWLILLPAAAMSAVVIWFKFLQLYEPIREELGSIGARRRRLVAAIAACLFLVAGTWLHFVFAARQEHERERADCARRFAPDLSTCAEGDAACLAIRDYTVRALCDKQP